MRISGIASNTDLSTHSKIRFSNGKILVDVSDL